MDGLVTKLRLLVPAITAACLLVCPPPASAAVRLKIGYANAPPIAYPRADGRPTGFGVDVLNEAARREGIELDWRMLPEGQSVEDSLRHGYVDLVPSLYETPERKQEFFVSAPWWTAEWTLLTAENSRIHSQADLRGTHLLVTGPQAVLGLFRERLPDTQVGSSESPSIALRALCRDREVPAIAMLRVELTRTLLVRPDLCLGVRIREVPIDVETKLSIVSRRAVQVYAAGIREHIDDLALEGRLAEIAARNPPLPPSIAILQSRILRHAYERRIWTTVVAAMAVILALAIVFLRRQARAKRELRRSRDEIAESEARFNLAAEHAGMGVWDVDIKNGKRTWTRNCYEVFGYEPGAFEATLEHWISRLHPEDRDRVLAEVQRARRERSLYSSRFRANRADNGAELWCEAYGRFEYDNAGEATRFSGVFIDVTSRKRAEAEFDAILDTVPAATFITHDPDCRRVVGSRMTYHLLRVPAGGNLANASSGAQAANRYRFVRNGRELPESELPLQTAVRTAQPVRNCELELVFDDGTSRRLFGHAMPVLDGAGRAQGGVCALIDITDLKRMEERLRHAQKLESIGLLAGGIAHDFNNILVAIVGNASLACEMLGAAGPVRDLLDQVIRSGEQAAHLTRQMLAYAGKGRFIIEPVSLSEAGRDTMALVRPSISKKISIHLDLAPELPAVEADPSQVQQVVMNLVLNAAEAIGDAAGLITLRTAAVDLDEAAARADLDGYEVAPGRYVSIEVRDTGCGMDSPTRARMFDPFFTTKFTGRGLGLAAVDGIVRAHKGAMRVTTAPGHGSTFVALFPAWDVRPAATAARRPDTHDLAGAGTVLVVDDDRAVRELAARTLELYGYSVLGAQDGPDAIALFNKECGRVDVVILDLSMPGMSGEEVLPELQKIRADVPVIVSSGYSEPEALRLFAGARVAGFIQKPYTTRQVAQKVKSVLLGRDAALA